MTASGSPRPPSRRDLLAALGATGALQSALGDGRLPLAPSWTTEGRYARAPGTDEAGDFLFEKGLVYLNTAALGPAPRQVLERTLQVWRELEGNPSHEGYGRLEHAMDGVRAQGAHLLGCDVEELVLTRSTTDGMNAVAQGMRLVAGDRVVTSDQEHPGGVSCWKYLARRNGVVLDVVPVPLGENDPARIVERFAAAVTPRTRVISVSHVLTSTGLRMPVPELAALARRNGALCVVDGAQAVGGIAVDVKALGCHAYATSGHKWLMGPKGTGLLFLAADTTGVIEPIVLEDGRAAYTQSSGVESIPSVMGLGAAIALAMATGVGEVERRAVALRDRVYAGLHALPRIEVVSPAPGALAVPFVTFRLPDAVESAAFGARLRERYGLVVKVVPKVWMNGIRVSTHVFNTEREVGILLRALRDELT